MFNQLKKIGGIVLVIWGAVRFVPDVLESAQATAKYGIWVYKHLGVPQSGCLTGAILIVGLGLIFSETIQAGIRRWFSKPLSFDAQKGPDLALKWSFRETFPRWDVVRLRNIGTESAFNVGLIFSWPELTFPVPFEINAIHANEEVEREPNFIEKMNGHTSNVGRMKSVLRDERFQSHPPLEVIVLFYDKEGAAFERRFTLEPGPGGHWGEEIKITPGKRVRLQATS